MLQFLIHLARNAKVVLEIRHGDRLFLVFRLLHRLFQHCMYHTNKVPCQNTTRFSNSARSSCRTGLALNSSVPPIGRSTSYQTDCGGDSFLDGLIEVLREPLGVQLTLVAVVPVVLK